jgi:anti-sigma regulatory factor (Ser/Thr protein kinase)
MPTPLTASTVTGAAARAVTASVPGQLDLSLDVTPDAVSSVRRIVAAHLELWGPPMNTLMERAELAVSELLTNVHDHTPPDRHGRRPAKLLVQRLPGGLCVNVRDTDGRLPAAQHPTADDERGRGLLLLQAIADDYGVSPHPTGKDVWVNLLVSHGASTNARAEDGRRPR